jgi:hypothetical protein
MSIRSKINSLLTPKPNRDIEDNTDIYDHTRDMFNKKGDFSGDEAMTKDLPDASTRRFRGEVELDELVYGGKKTTRKAMEEKDMESDGSEQDFDLEGDSDGDSDELGGEAGEEEGDEEMGESSLDEEEDDEDEVMSGRKITYKDGKEQKQDAD